MHIKGVYIFPFGWAKGTSPYPFQLYRMDDGFSTNAAAAKSLQSCPTLRPHRQQPTRLPRAWDSPGKNTGVGCHFLFQCIKVKRESEVAQSCLTLSDPMDCSLPGSSIHGIFQARVLELGYHRLLRVGNDCRLKGQACFKLV